MRLNKLMSSVATLASITLILGVMSAIPADAKKKKKKKPTVCQPFAPWENAAEAEVSIVTDKATEQAPVEVTIPTEAGMGSTTNEPEDGDEAMFTSHAWANLQVKSKALRPELSLRLEFADYQDYDLYARNSDGSSEVYAAGFNPAPDVNDGSGHGGHSEVGAEVLDAVTVKNCQGYSLDIAGAATEGGDVTLKLWLQKPGTVPAVQPSPSPTSSSNSGR